MTAYEFTVVIEKEVDLALNFAVAPLSAGQIANASRKHAI